MTISNLGGVIVRDATRMPATSAGLASLLSGGSLLIPNGTFQIGPTATGILTNGGVITMRNDAILAAGVITNTGTIRSVGGGVITGSVANLAGGLIVVIGTDGNGTLSLANPQPFADNVNYGTLQLLTNATLNIGGTNAATAMGSFTNRGSINFTFPNNGSTGATILNAGTIVNDVGAFLNVNNRSGISNRVHADVINYGGISLNDTGVDLRYFRSLSTNAGSLNTGNNAGSLTFIQNGSFHNSGRFDGSSGSDETFIVEKGIFYNAAGGTSLFDRTAIRALAFVQDGFLSINMSGVTSSFLDTNGTTRLAITHNGTLRWEPPAMNGNIPIMTGSKLDNNGTFEIFGKTNLINAIPAVQASFLVSGADFNNRAGGTLTVQSNGLANFDAGFLNLGTINIASNSVVSAGRFSSGTTGIGANGTAPSFFFFSGGINGWTNSGTVNLVNGSFLAVRSLTNAPTGVIAGAGHVGPVHFQTITNSAGSVTQFVQNVTVANVMNAGRITPDGTLNIGAITNLSGGSIIGSGVIQSINVTNFFFGLTLINSNIDVGARIVNNAGATILARGGTLVLSNGFIANSQAGAIGATNGGRLQLGDGTFALTNNGAIWLTGGEIIEN